MAPTLPIDIIVDEILPRLPAKSLLRFKCVCKFFQTLISSPELVDLHLRYSPSSDDNRLLIVTGSLQHFYSVDLDTLESLTGDLSHPILFNWRSNLLFIYGSCNGLVCIGDYSNNLIVLNPSTGIFREIYFPDFEVREAVGFGFGYDDLNDDYKVCFMPIAPLGSSDVLRIRVMVYSLQANEWRRIEDGLYNMINCDDDCTILGDHLVHWYFWCPIQRRLRIVCFNLRKERWCNDVPLPDYDAEAGAANSDTHFVGMPFKIYWDNQHQVVHLGTFDGCLCLSILNWQQLRVDVWVMKEYRVKESWMKLMEFAYQGKIAPLVYAKGSRQEILLSKNGEFELCWYNVRDKTSNRFQISGVSDIYFNAHVCKGSLVTVPGGTKMGAAKQPTEGRIGAN